jgi:hypothetical protein
MRAPLRNHIGKAIFHINFDARECPKDIEKATRIGYRYLCDIPRRWNYVRKSRFERAFFTKTKSTVIAVGNRWPCQLNWKTEGWESG